MKKFLAVILAVITIITMVPFTAFAQSAENYDENGQMTTETTATGNNSVGTYLAETFEEAQAENQENTSDLAGMSNLSFDGKTATVEFATQVDTQLVVAIYSEDGTKMLASGVKNVTTEDRKVTVDIASATLPEYYLVKAFLLDANNHSALCGEFIDDTHTKAYQDFEALDIYDFDADKVINLDSNPDNNFLVVADGAIEIFGNESTNTFVSADYDAGEYIFDNVADDIKSLKVGDVFYYQSNEKYEVIKVKSIAINGTKATIIADSMDIEEAFKAIKINSSEFEDNTTSVSRIAKVKDTEYTVKDDFVNGTFTVKLGEDEKGNIKPVITKDFTVGDEENPETDEEKDYNDSDFKFVAEATGSAKLTAKLVVYVKDDYKKVEFTVTGSVGLEIKVGVEFDKTLKLGDFFFTFFKVVTIGVEIKFHFNIHVILTISGKIEFVEGFKWTSVSKKFTEVRKPCEFKPEVKVEGEIYIGLILAPYVSVISKNVLYVSFPIDVGASVSAELSTAVGDDKNHSCNACLDGNIDIKLEAQAKVYIARKIDWLEKTYSSPEFKIKWHLWDFYWSITYSEFGWGECPYITSNGEDSNPDSGTDEIPDNVDGKCGDNAYWIFDEETYTLTILGSGSMYDFTYNSRPWESNVGLIKNIVIKNDIKSIGDYSFYNCHNLENIIISNSVTNIGERSFEACISLTDFTIPDGVISIGDNAFRSCTNMESVTIGNNVTSIGFYAFCGCSSLVKIIIPNSVTDIGGNAFRSCKNLENVSMGNGVTNIGSEAFRYCYSLTHLIIPESVMSIGYIAFDNCTNLEYITVDKNNKRYSNDEYGVLFDKNKEKLIRYPAGNDRADYIIPDSVTRIDGYAFSECVNLANITIPNSVTSIKQYSFYNCSNLTNITIPDSITYIEKNAFGSCTNLVELIVPNSVTSIGEWAFSHCSSLKKIILPNTITTISNDEFYYCTSLTSITIPDSVTSIGSSAFEFCTSLIRITIPDSVTSIGSNAFRDCTSLISITIPDSVTSIGGHAFEDCTSLTSITIPSSVTYIGDGAFEFCTSLIGITIPDCVTSIGRSVFEKCKSLTSVTVGKNVTSIGDSAFEDCTSLPSITVPNGVTSIGEEAFENCSSLTSIIIPDSVKSIGARAFDYCGSITDVYYTGTEIQWKSISIGGLNDDLTNATVYFNYNDTYTQSTFSLTENVSVTYSFASAQADADTDVISFAYGYCIADNKYVVLNVLNYGDDFELTTDNLLYIDVVTADENGNIDKSFEPIYYDDQSTTLLIGDFGSGTETFIIYEPENVECSVSIQTPSLTTIRCKDGIVLHANVEGNLPQGTRIVWSTDNDYFKTEQIDENSYQIISNSKGYTTVTVSIVDADDNILASDSIEMYSKAGFFDKLGGFFRSIFGSTKIYDK